MVSRDKATQIGLHSVRNILGESAQLNLFSNHDIRFAEEFGIKLSGKIDRFGIDLTEIQARVMEGILRGFSETQYLGNISPRNKETIIKEKYLGKHPSSYKYILEVPCMTATQSQILDWAGINKKSISCWARAVEAIHELGTKQYCFYYDRLVYENGQPLREPNGRWKKEEVISVDTLFVIKEIRNEFSGELKYYEIRPSTLFLDQRESYFMLIPYGWREEVKRLVGNKKASSYTFRFLLFLRYQYELMRRSIRYNPPYQIKYSPEEIAIAIKMPESIYKRKKKKMNEILEDAFIVAKRLGYLLDFERKHLDVLTLDEKKYFNPKDIELGRSIEAIGDSRAKHESVANILYELFISCRKTLDPSYQQPTEKEKIQYLNDFIDLINIRPVEDIETIIKWSISHKYWGAKLHDPKFLKKEFHAVWSEYTLSQKDAENKNPIEKNRKFAKETLSQHENKSFRGSFILVCQNYVEFTNAGAGGSSVIDYEDKNFIAKVKLELEKRNIKC